MLLISSSLCRYYSKKAYLKLVDQMLEKKSLILKSYFLNFYITKPMLDNCYSFITPFIGRVQTPTG